MLSPHQMLHLYWCQSSWIMGVYLVGLWCITVSYKDTLPPRQIELGPFLLWDMYVRREANYSQMADFWFLSWESLFKSLVFKCSMRGMVLYIHSCSCYLLPKVHRKILVKQHFFRCSHYGPVLWLCNPILLRIVWSAQIPLNPIFSTEFLELFWGEFSTIILP